jgi:hypothetical protein
MQDRKFVLLPIQDLNLDWKHPILKKNISELLEDSLDKSICEGVGKPIIALEQFNYAKEILELEQP